MGSAHRLNSERASKQRTGAPARAMALRARIRELAPENAAAFSPTDFAAAEQRAREKTTMDARPLAALARQINHAAAGHTGEAPVDEHDGDKPTAGSEAVWIVADSSGPALCSVRRRPKLAPSWLVSVLVHTMLLVALGLLTHSRSHLSTLVFIDANRAELERISALSEAVEIAGPDVANDETVRDDQVSDLPPLDLAIDDPRMDDDIAASRYFDDQGQRSALDEQLEAVQRAGGGTVPRQRRSGGGAQFYGIQAQGDRFVFIVDSSTSMRLKFADARRELEEAVRRLSPEQLFYVIFFDRDAERMRLGHWNEDRTRYSMKTRSEPDLVPAAGENIESLIYWMNTIQLDSDTNPYPAVAYTLRKLNADAIFLLSDGEFHDGGATEAFLLRENKLVEGGQDEAFRTIVHCVGFYSRLGEVTLQRIAEANGGTYRFIAPPAGLLMPAMPKIRR